MHFSTARSNNLFFYLKSILIYVSTKSACSDSNSRSDAVYALTHDNEAATSSIRISLSHLTTKSDVEYFLDKFSICYNELTNLK